jgi:hypothetical protein
MRTIALTAASLTLMLMVQANASDDEHAPIPASCPVTVATPQTRFTPPPPSKDSAWSDSFFWYGTDALYTHLRSDGRWSGIKSETGTRNKSFWYRKNPEWLMENPYQFMLTAKRLESDEAAFTLTGSDVTNAIMGDEVAMLTMLELPERGCWEITGNYKDAYLSFVVWLD